jgi:hypothetical protein
MYLSLRKIALLLATSTGLITTTTLAAEAGVRLNHCTPRLPR